MLLIASALLAGSVSSAADFSKYKKVEAYEIRPGILIMPVYNSQGELCEIGLQPRSYSPELIRVGEGLSRDAIMQIFDELVPAEERGPQPENLLERGMILMSGQTAQEYETYENVTLNFFWSISGQSIGARSKHAKVKAPPENSSATYDSASIDFKDHPCK